MTSPGPRARGKNSPERGNFQALPPPHGGSVPSAFFLSFLSGRWRFLANSLRVASARVSLFSLPRTAARKVASRRFHQVEPRGPPPRAVRCQRGLSVAGVFGIAVTFSFDSSRCGWGRRRRGGPGGGRGGGGGGGSGRTTRERCSNGCQYRYSSSSRSSWLRAGRADGAPTVSPPVGWVLWKGGHCLRPQHLPPGSSSPAAGRRRR